MPADHIPVAPSYRHSGRYAATANSRPPTSSVLTMASTVLGGAVEPPCWAAAAAMTAVAAASAAHMMLRTGYAGGRVSAIYILLLILL